MKSILFLGQYARQFYRTLSPSFLKNYKVDFKPLSNKYDYAVFFENCDKEIISINAKQVIYISGEPKEILERSDIFFKQFDFCCATYGNSKNIYKKQYTPWHLGLFLDPQKYDYNYFCNTHFKKNKVILGISSNKNMIQGHIKRHNFCLSCLKKIPNFELYGRGIKDFKDKIDFLPKYKYNVVIENCSVPDYWTEKLSDSFLSECYTFYYGCSNIKQYFPENSLTIININKIDESINLIKNAIQNNYYEKYISEIQISKKRILNDYNISQIFSLKKVSLFYKTKIIDYNKASSTSHIVKILNKIKRIIKGVLKHE